MSGTASLAGDPATRLPVDLRATPFSIRGSFFAVSIPDDQAVPGVYLRTVRGGARVYEVLRLVVGGEALPEIAVHAGRLVLTGGGARAEIALAGPGRAVLRVERGEVALELCVRDRYDVVLEERPGIWRFVASGAVRNYRLRLAGGAGALRSGWDADHSTDGVLTVRATDTPAVLAIDEFGSAPPADLAAPDLDALAAAAADDFRGWWERHGAPVVAPALAADLDPARRADAARLAAYVTWSALVPAGGVLRRESMLMSKNRMAHIWSWDHCFNALALHRDPDAAVGQLLTILDHQDEHGGLPDHIDDERVQFNFAKPPVHGWTVSRLLDLGALDAPRLHELYGPLVRWTEWWWRHRVHGGDGIPSYHHGNDSGWDNSTVFGRGVPVQSPDLVAFLALQEHALARVAEALGRGAEAERWRQRSAQTVERMLAHFRVDAGSASARFVARDTRTGAPIDSDSLLTLMPLALGELLPPDVFAEEVRHLETGGWVTAHGPATEPPSSPHYEPDGYWRGPVWAPTTLLLVDGLRRGGATALAERLATGFVAAAARSGMAENFDALTGAGLRDRSMTWTASVLLTLLDPATGASTGSDRATAATAESDSAAGSARMEADERDAATAAPAAREEATA